MGCCKGIQNSITAFTVNLATDLAPSDCSLFYCLGKLLKGSFERDRQLSRTCHEMFSGNVKTMIYRDRIEHAVSMQVAL